MKKLILMIFFTSLIKADFVMVYQMPQNSKQVIEYKDQNHVKITLKDANNKVNGVELFVDGKYYMGTLHNGKIVYKDMSVMLQRAKAMYGNVMQEEEEEQTKNQKDDFKVVKKGKKINYLGIDAWEWELLINDNGQKNKVKVIVTKDKAFINAIKKVSNLYKKYMDSNEDNFDMELEDGYYIVSFEDMKLLKFKQKDIPNSNFTINSGKKSIKFNAKKPPLCPITKPQGKAKDLLKIVKKEANGWKLIENATCMRLMGISLENAIYKKGNSYIHITLSLNSNDGGMVAKYLVSKMQVKDLKRGKIQNHRYQGAYLALSGVNALDIKLKNGVITLNGANSVDELISFAKEAFDLSKFKPSKSTKPNMQMPNMQDLEKLKKMFGQ
jgi:hypothetical protein